MVRLAEVKWYNCGFRQTIKAAWCLHFPTKVESLICLQVHHFSCKTMIQLLCFVPCNLQVTESRLCSAQSSGMLLTEATVWVAPLELCSAQPAQPYVTALIIFKGSHATLRICSRPFIGWSGSTYFTAFKLYMTENLDKWNAQENLSICISNYTEHEFFTHIVPICIIILSSTETGPNPWGTSCPVSLVTIG